MNRCSTLARRKSALHSIAAPSWSRTSMPRRVCSCWSLRQINLVAVHGSHGQVLGSRSKPERAALPPATRRSARCEPCLIDDDRPLPSNPPAAGLKLARSRMAWLPTANGSFSGMGITGPVKRERQLATHPGRSPWPPWTPCLGCFAAVHGTTMESSPPPAPSDRRPRRRRQRLSSARPDRRPPRPLPADASSLALHPARPELRRWYRL
jgi:hypothetical protein